MKLDVLTGSLGPAAAGILLIALSDAAIRSEGEAARPDGRVPGSSGWSGGNSGAIAARAGDACGSRISLMVRGTAAGVSSAAAAWKSRGAATNVSCADNGGGASGLACVAIAIRAGEGSAGTLGSGSAIGGGE